MSKPAPKKKPAAKAKPRAKAPAKKPVWKLVLAGGGAAMAVGVAGAWAVSTPVMPSTKTPAYPSARLKAVPPAENAFFVYAQGADQLRFPMSTQDKKWHAVVAALTEKPGPLPAPALRFVAENAGAMAALREARRVRAFRAVPSGDKPKLVPFQQLNRLAVADMRRLAAAGQHGAAFERAVDAFVLNRRLVTSNGQDLLIGMTGVANSEFLLKAIALEWPQLGKAPTPTLAAFLKNLNHLDKMDRPIEALVTAERDFELADLRDRHAKEGIEADMTEFMATQVGRAFDRQAMFMSQRDIKGMVEDYETYASGPPDPPMLFASAIFHRQETQTSILMTMAAPSPGSWTKFLRCEGGFDALRLRVAAELYQRAHAKAPANVAALVPAFLPAAPPDPFQPSSPLRYRNGKIWSIGWDGQDDGGASELAYKDADKKFNVNGTGDLLL